ncbi:MAG: hypothetical protein ABIV25_11090, partial [Paracoccaceae bacterium]
GRVFGDKARLIFGPRAVVIFGGVFGATAMGIGLALGSAVGGITAMGFLGLAHATLVPLLFSLAGKIKTGAPATNISSVMAIGFCGQIIGPPLIGAIAQQFGLATGMFCIVGASALVALLAVLVLARDE